MGQEYIPVKRSQITFFQETQLYYFSKDGEPLIYKKKGAALDKSRIQLNNYPELFVHSSDKESASKELLKALNYSLANID